VVHFAKSAPHHTTPFTRIGCVCKRMY